MSLSCLITKLHFLRNAIYLGNKSSIRRLSSFSLTTSKALLPLYETKQEEWSKALLPLCETKQEEWSEALLPLCQTKTILPL